jgi:transcriptional regulator with XRE-family HTH domain
MQESELLKQLGQQLRRARLAANMTQERIADLAGVSRPRYRDIETGAAAARTTTLVNIARALGMEMMLVPQRMVPAVESMLHATRDDDDDRPAFLPDGDDDEPAFGRGN